MILLDTNVLSELMKPIPNADVVAWLDEQPESTLFVCAITRAEIELGIALLPDGKRKHDISAASRKMFGEFHGRLLVFGEMSAIQYGPLVANRTKQGYPISVEDAQIASIALAHGLQLATRNVKDFRDIPMLAVINPWQLNT